MNDCLSGLSKEQIAMICGKLLGDATISRQPGRQPRFRFSHAVKDRDWCSITYQKLSETLPLSPPKFKRTPDPRLKNGYSDCYYVQSKCCPIITELYEQWYKDKRKVIPFDLIEKALSPILLAYWYQDDGNLKIKDGKPVKVILSTECFRLSEISCLKSIFSETFQIDFHMDAQKRLLLYNKASIYYFLSIVRPFLVNSMKRKDIVNQKSTIKKSKMRTTLSIPSEIPIKNPTKEITHLLSRLHVLNSLLQNKACYENWYRETGHQLIYQKRKPRKTYQILLPVNLLNDIECFKSLTGMQASESVTACYYSNIKKTASRRKQPMQDKYLLT